MNEYDKPASVETRIFLMAKDSSDEMHIFTCTVPTADLVDCVYEAELTVSKAGFEHLCSFDEHHSAAKAIAPSACSELASLKPMQAPSPDSLTPH